MTRNEVIEKFRDMMQQRLDGWDEAEHPRDENGRFSSSGVSSKASISKESIEKKVSSAPKTEKGISKALEGLGFKNTSKEHGCPNFEKETDDGKLRVYVSGSGRNKEIKVQKWDTYKETLASKAEIKNAEDRMKSFMNKYKDKEFKFADLKNDDDRYTYALMRTYDFKRKIGIGREKAMTDAINNAELHKKDGFKDYLDGDK